jgi:hypothetical protein
MHPLAPNLTAMTNEELEKNYTELNKKYTMASRSGSYTVLPQIAMLLNDYREEIQNRHKALLEKAASQNPNFKNIIDIK